MVNIYEILQKIGFDWQVALANLFNFLIIFFIFKKFGFPYIKKIINERQRKISEGLDKAEEADVRLREIDNIGIKKLKEAEQKSIDMINKAKQSAKIIEEELIKKAEEKQKNLLAQTQLYYVRQKEESERLVLKEAEEIVKKFIVKTVELGPELIDEALIKKAVTSVKKEI